MDHSTLNSKGQVTIPKRIRDALGAKAGDRITFAVLPGGAVILRAKTRNIADPAGVLFKEGREPVPIEKLSWP